MLARRDKPLIGVPAREGDQEAVQYCTDVDDAAATPPVSAPMGTTAPT